MRVVITRALDFAVDMPDTQALDQPLVHRKMPNKVVCTHQLNHLT